MTQQGAQSDVI